MIHHRHKRKIAAMEPKAQTLLMPGTYRKNMVTPSGKKYVLARCPHCWMEFELEMNHDTDIANGLPSNIECKCCGKPTKYRNADCDTDQTRESSGVRAGVRSGHVGKDSPVSSELYDVCPNDGRERTDVGNGIRA